MRLIPVQEAHRLCSGQVITSPTDAVKELIDNSLDSGATIVQIALTDSGLQAIEVTDNGTGIRDQDFDQLCLKYTTSKLTSFEELRNVTSLGFRGEALSSLCSLCTTVRILTKFTGSDVGHVLEFDESGKIIKKMAHPRPPGTTVTLKGLFERLAVRRKFFEREKSQSNKIVNKMMNLVMDYALALPHIKFLLTDCHNSSRKDLLTLPDTKSLRERISIVLKPKPVFESLSLVSDILPEVAEEFSVSMKEDLMQLLRKIEMEAAISKPGHGRSNSERQFFSVNGRPVQFTKLSKIINQTFRSYDPTGSGNQYPFFAINLKLPAEMVDVNVTPDKRTILVSHENALFAIIKSSVIVAFGRDPVSIEQAKYTESSSQVTIVSEDRETSPHRRRISDVTLTQFSSADASGSKRITDFFDATPRPADQTPAETAAVATGELVTESRPAVTPYREPDIIISNPLQPVSLISADGVRQLPFFQTARSALNAMPRINAFEEAQMSDLLRGRSRSGSADSADLDRSARVRSHIRRHSVSPGLEVDGDGQRSNKRIRCSTPTTDFSPPTFRVPDVSQIRHRGRARSEGDTFPNTSPAHTFTDRTPTSSSSRCVPVHLSRTVPTPIPKRPSIRITVDMDEVRQSPVTYSAANSSQGSQGFRLDLESAASEEEAIGEMQRLLKKSDFKVMQIIGQFNRSFIVTQLGKDLLIVDQHASDERRNFDHLLENSELEPQKLMVPEKLELTIYQESRLRLYQNRFERNGFRFAYDVTAEAGSRFSLIGVPSSGEKVLSSADVYELLEAITSAPSVPGSIRSSKVKEILAMRACKKSIKINDSLTMEQMRRVVDAMSETSSPWTCAHGRPTVRFLSRIGREKARAVLPEVSSQAEEEVDDF